MDQEFALFIIELICQIQYLIIMLFFLSYIPTLLINYLFFLCLEICTYDNKSFNFNFVCIIILKYFICKLLVFYKY